MFISAIPAVFVSLLAFASNGVKANGPRSECFEQTRIAKGDTCDTIRSWSGLSDAQIEALNPGFSCSSIDTLVGHYLCVGSWLPTCYLNVTATETTCGSLAASFNLSIFQFVQLNDNVDDACDDLVVGSPYCVSATACYPGDPNPYCDDL